jgi:ubiquitin conjugation factor E4 B
MAGTAAKRGRMPSDGVAAEDKLPPRKINVSKLESLDDFSDRILSDILQATVDPSRADLKGSRLDCLTGLSEELRETGAPLKLTASHLDQALMEAATAWPQDKPLLSYLLPCWSRAQKYRRTATKNLDVDKIAVLDEAKRLCVSNCLFAITMPNLYQYVV